MKASVYVESNNAYKQSRLTRSEVFQHTPIGRGISDVNKVLGNHVGRLLIQTYGSAKKLTLAANNFPARIVISHMAEHFFFFLTKNLMKNLIILISNTLHHLPLRNY